MQVWKFCFGICEEGHPGQCRALPPRYRMRVSRLAGSVPDEQSRIQGSGDVYRLPGEFRFVSYLASIYQSDVNVKRFGERVWDESMSGRSSPWLEINSGMNCRADVNRPYRRCEITRTGAE